MFSTGGHISESQALTKEYLFSLVSEYDIFKKYIANFSTLNRSFCSELRKDTRPSCSVSLLSSGLLIYKDFSTGESFTCIRYLQYKFSLDYNQALRLIANDFGILVTSKEVLIQKKEISEQVIEKAKKEITEFVLRITSKPFTKEGLAYWSEYGITEDVLQLYDIKQLSHVTTMIMQVSLGKELAFAYCFGDYKYKILRPNAPREIKWISNVKQTTIQGLKQLPKEGELLIITKAMKDVMTLRSLGYYAIAPQAESVTLPLEAIKWLKERWKKIIIYYDNDSPGIKAGQEHSLLYELPMVHNPLDASKDVSDYYRDNQKEKTLELLKGLFYE